MFYFCFGVCGCGFGFDWPQPIEMFSGVLGGGTGPGEGGAGDKSIGMMMGRSGMSCKHSNKYCRCREARECSRNGMRLPTIKQRKEVSAEKRETVSCFQKIAANHIVTVPFCARPNKRCPVGARTRKKSSSSISSSAHFCSRASCPCCLGRTVGRRLTLPVRPFCRDKSGLFGE